MNNPCEHCYLSIKKSRLPSREKVRRRALLFITDVPTILDVKAGNLFNGRTTSIVRDCMDSFKLTPFVEAIPLVRCVCSPSRAHEFVDNCSYYTEVDIVEFEPRMIVTVGELAYKTVKDPNCYNFKKIVNKPVRFNDIILMPIHSPTYIKKYNAFDSYIEGFRKIQAIYRELDPFGALYI